MGEDLLDVLARQAMAEDPLDAPNGLAGHAADSVSVHGRHLPDPTPTASLWRSMGQRTGWVAASGRTRAASGKFAVSLGALLLAVSSFLTTQAASAARVASTTTENAPPPARYGVGQETLNLVDSTRGTPANGSAPALPYRKLTTWVLYPSTVAPSGNPVANAPPAVAGKPFPLIVFAHGLDSEGFIYDPLLEQWVERGYVVVAPTFPLSNIAAPGGDTAKDLANQPGDLSFVLGQALSLSNEPGNLLSGMIDPRRIAGVGHSLGAMTVLAWTENTCCRDPRVDAAVVIDGTETRFGSGKFFTGRTTPILVLHGTADTTIPYAAGKKIYADAKPPKFFVSLLGAPHVSFEQLELSQQKAPKWESVDVDSVLDFLGGELDHDQSALRQLAVVGREPGLARFEETTNP
jgi:predicted dienelactone hydrolase